MFKQSVAMLVLASGLAMASMPAALAADEVNVAPGLSTINAPLGLHGADPVALLGGKNLTGNSAIAAKHDGVAYYFASEANKKAFEANPANFIPETGGFCAYGVVVGKKFDGDPRFSTVVDGKLYVFLNQATLDAFNKDVRGNVQTAADNWSRIEHTKATDL